MANVQTVEVIKKFLDEQVFRFNNPLFISSDPIAIPHQFSLKEDIEISGFLVATIAWGNRKSILRSGHKLLEFMDDSPFDFVMNHSDKELAPLLDFNHRTFNGGDLQTFIKALQHIYFNYGGLEGVFTKYQSSDSLQASIGKLKQLFFELPHFPRTQKHISDPGKGSAAKRINMFLRWMIRQDTAGVDFGIWKNISPSKLSCPLDVHSGRMARKLGLLLRKQNDAKAVSELDTQLRLFDSEDPAKYDFALFGLALEG